MNTALKPALGNQQPALSSLKDTSRALIDAYRILRKRWLWAVSLTLSTIIATAFYTAGKQRIYRSSCVIQIDPKPPKPLGQEVQAIVDIGTNSYGASTEYNRTQVQIIKSRAIAEETVRRLSLHRDPTFLQWRGKKDQPTDRVPPENTDVEAAARLVRANLVVEPIRDTRLVTISYLDPNPERARQILATLVSVFVDRNIDVALDSTNSAADWLRGQLDNLKNELEDSEIALHEYKKGNRILSVSLEDQSNMLRQEIQQLNTALTAVRVRRAQVAAQAEALQSLDNNNAPARLPSSDLLNDTTLERLRNALDQAVVEHDSLVGSGKGEMHPLVAAASARKKAAEQALQQELFNVKAAAQRELSVVDHEIKSLSTLLAQAQERAHSLGRLEIDYRRLERGKANTEKLYSLVLERSKESDLTRMMRFNNIQVIDPPLVPRVPAEPKVPLNIAIGALCGVALGLLGAFGREMLDQTVKSQADIEDLGVTFLGHLPRLGDSHGPAYGGRRVRGKRARMANGQRAGLAVHDDPTSAVAEAARGVRTNLVFMSPDKPFRTLLVTSGGPAEGKTTVACWLAIAMAQAGHRVVLMDCDLRRPRLHSVFGLVNDRGVTSALVDRSTISSAIHETEVPNLVVLTSGPSSPSPAESLQSKSFELLLSDLASSYDRVVIDSPPVGPVTDGVVLSTRVDATLMVVRALTSARDMVRQARRSLLDVRANLAGAVLNAAERDRHRYSHYRYYDRIDSENQSERPKAQA